MVLRVSQLAQRTGTSPDTIRYYGRLGLLPEAGRTEAGHRYYDDGAVERLRFIKGAQWLDLRLAEIGELLAVLDGDGCPCGFSAELLRRRIAEIDQQRTRLEHMRALLCRLLGDTGAPPAAPATTPAANEPTAAACGCCQPAQPSTTEGHIRELEARRAAVERRLQGLGNHAPDHPSVSQGGRP